MTEHPRPAGHPGRGGPPGAAPDEELMRALYHEHAGPLLGYVLRLVAGDRQRAEDVVQETMLRAWRTVDRLDTTRESLRPWLVTVARRIVIDGHRGRLARPREVAPLPPDDLPDRPPDGLAADDPLDRVLRRMTLADALGDLTDAHREVLVQTYFRGRTVDEAAERLGIPPGTVKSRLHYALRALRLALEERGVTP